MPSRYDEGDYPYAYQGQEKDTETGMEAFELRLWDARLGRWLTTDPYGQFHSPYLGMENNPLNGTDPDGGWFLRPEQIVDLNITIWNLSNGADLGTIFPPITFYGALTNFIDILNGGPLYEYETGQKAPQLIGTMGIAGGTKALTTATKLSTQALNKVDEFTNLLKPMNELDTSVTLFRGFTGTESASSAIFFTDDAAVAATYVKNGLSVHSIKVSEFALLKLEQTGELLRLTGKQSVTGITSNEFQFIGTDLVKAIIGISF